MTALADDGLDRHRGARAIERMVEFAPATGGLALWMRHRDAEAGPGAPVVTDGTVIAYRPEFAGLPRDVQTGWVAHEVLHVALRHPQRYLDLQQVLGDVDLDLYNICADAIVNSTLAHLTWLQLPPGAVTLDQVLKQALDVGKPVVEAALLEWDVERLYRAIDDRRASPQSGGRRENQSRDGATQQSEQGAKNPSSGGAGQSRHQAAARADGPRAATVRALGASGHRDLVPDPDSAAPPEAEAEQAREWRERLTRAHANDGAHSMLRALIADLPKQRTPWEQVLRTHLARGLARKTDVSWSRPSRSYIANQGRSGPGRRLPFEPGTTATKAVPRLVLVVDVSGSIDDGLMERFAREIEAIVRRTEAGLVLVIGDDAVRQVTRFEPGRTQLRDIVFDGAGGTDFTPLLEEADRHGPDIGVVLTDLDGPARYRPSWPVIWAVTEAHAAAVAPFGRKLVLS